MISASKGIGVGDLVKFLFNHFIGMNIYSRMFGMFTYYLQLDDVGLWLADMWHESNLENYLCQKFNLLTTTRSLYWCEFNSMLFDMFTDIYIFSILLCT